MDGALHVTRTHDVVADRLVSAPDGRWAALADDRLLTLVTDGVMQPLPDPPLARVGSVAFSTDGNVLLAAPGRLALDTTEWLDDTPPSIERGWRPVTWAWDEHGSELAWVIEGPDGAQQVWWRSGSAEAHHDRGAQWASMDRLVLTSTDEGRPLVIGASIRIETWLPLTGAGAWSTSAGRWAITRLVPRGDSVITGDAGGTVTARRLRDGAPTWSVDDVGGEVTGLAPLGDLTGISTADGDVIVLDGDREVARTTIAPTSDLASIGSDRLLAALSAPAVGVIEMLLSV